MSSLYPSGPCYSWSVLLLGFSSALLLSGRPAQAPLRPKLLPVSPFLLLVFISRRMSSCAASFCFFGFFLGCHSLCGLFSWLQEVWSFSARGISIGWGAAVQVNHVSPVHLGCSFLLEISKDWRIYVPTLEFCSTLFLSKHSRKSGPLTGSSPTLLDTPTNSSIFLPGWHISHVKGATFHIVNSRAVQVLLMETQIWHSYMLWRVFWFEIWRSYMLWRVFWFKRSDALTCSEWSSGSKES